MIQKAVEWFNNLSNSDKIAIVIPVGLTFLGGLFALFKWLFTQKTDSQTRQKSIEQNGNNNKTIISDGNKGNIAVGDIHTGIDSDSALKTIVEISTKYGRSEKENELLEEKVSQLETQLAKPAIETGIASKESMPVPSTEAKDLAKLITQDDGLYAQALKAIAEGNSKQADELLNETQQILDKVQQAKDKAQSKIYLARIHNLFYAGRFRDALQYCDKLLPLAGNDTLILNGIAAVYYENAAYQKAEPLMRRALEIDEKSFGKDHPDVARDLNNLAQLLNAANRPKEAEPLMRRALEIDEKSFGKDHPNIARDFHNLAGLLQATNRFKEAEPLMLRALEIDEKSFGKDHPNVAIHLNNLVTLLKETNRLKEAEPLMRRALEIDEKSFGKDHPDVARDLNNLAKLLKAANRLKEAEPLMLRALEINERFLGKDHPNVATNLNDLSLLLGATNRLEEAESLMRRALEINEKFLGKDHPDVAANLNNLALLLQATNRLKEAELLMKRGYIILANFKRLNGYQHPRMTDALINYTFLLTQMGYSPNKIVDLFKGLDPEGFK